MQHGMEQTKTFQQRLGARLRAARENSGMSQREAAARAHLSNTSLSNYESGLRGVSLETLRTLVAIYETTYEAVIP